MCFSQAYRMCIFEIIVMCLKGVSINFLLQQVDDIQDGRRGRSAFSWGGALAPPEEGEERPRRARSDADSEDKASPVTLTRCPLDTVSLSGEAFVLLLVLLSVGFKRSLNRSLRLL